MLPAKTVEIVAEAKDNASAEAGRLTAAAHSADRSRAPGGVRFAAREVGTLALDLAGGVIGETLSDDQKAKSVVDRFLAELEASEKASN